MSRIEKVMEWLKTAPCLVDAVDLKVDYTDDVPGSAGLFPSGTQEIGRRIDIEGGTTITCRDNFAVYFRWPTYPDDSVMANAEERLEALGDWVRMQSALRQCPVLGDEPYREVMTAGLGRLWSGEDGSSVYSITITAQYIKHTEAKEVNKWLT